MLLTAFMFHVAHLINNIQTLIYIPVTLLDKSSTLHCNVNGRYYGVRYLRRRHGRWEHVVY